MAAVHCVRGGLSFESVHRKDDNDKSVVHSSFFSFALQKEGESIDQRRPTDFNAVVPFHSYSPL